MPKNIPDDQFVSRHGVMFLAAVLFLITVGLFAGLYSFWPTCRLAAKAGEPVHRATQAASPAANEARANGKDTTTGSATASPSPSPTPYTLKVISISPTSGQIEGGSLVTIKGSGFKAEARVTFDGREGIDRTSTDGESFAVETPPHEAGSVDVAVINPDGKSDVLVTAYRYDCPPPSDSRLLLIVIMAGALGGALHALRSLYWYVGNRQLRISWVLMYFTLPFSGAAVATIFFLVVRGGFMNTSPSQEASTAIIGIAALVGLFSQQATLKLRDIANAVLTKPGEGANSQPQASEPVNGKRDNSQIDKEGADALAPLLSPEKGSTAGGDKVMVTSISLSSVVSVTFDGKPVKFENFDPAAASLTLTTPPHAEGEVDVTFTDKAGQNIKAKFRYETRD